MARQQLRSLVQKAWPGHGLRRGRASPQPWPILFSTPNATARMDQGKRSSLSRAPPGLGPARPGSADNMLHFCGAGNGMVVSELFERSLKTGRRPISWKVLRHLETLQSTCTAQRFCVMTALCYFCGLYTASSQCFSKVTQYKHGKTHTRHITPESYHNSRTIRSTSIEAWQNYVCHM